MSEILRIHHLDCCTMCPVAAKVPGGHLVAHVLAIETAQAGIVLVDTGIGDGVRRDPRRWLGRPFTALVRPQVEPAGSARAHLERLGLDPGDVRHIVLTHLDLDHAGGLADFPTAKVHVHQDELDAAMAPTWRERERYRAIEWAHGPDWAPFRRTGEAWFGFDAVHDLEGLPSQILAVPLPGHTRGHAAIAVEGPNGWLLHAGDAYFQAETVDPAAAKGSPVIRTFEQLVGVDRKRVAANHERLAELHRNHGGSGGVTVFCAHDPGELARLAG